MDVAGENIFYDPCHLFMTSEMTISQQKDQTECKILCLPQAVKSVKRNSCAEQLIDEANGRLSIIYDEIAAVPRIALGRRGNEILPP